MRYLYFICALVAFGASPAGAQAPAADSRGYMVFLHGTPIGREDITVRTEGGNLVVTGTGRLSPPLDIVTKRAEVRYGPDWTPLSLELQGTVRLRDESIKITFANGEATVEGTVAGKPISKTDKVSPTALILPNGFFGFHEALARRLATVTPPSDLAAYVAPIVEVQIRVQSVANERVQTGSQSFNVRRYALAFANPGGDVAFQLTTDEQGRLIRITIPAQALDIVRQDVAASTSRTQSYSNPGDESVTIPANGFNIAATVTKPKTAAAKYPAIVLIAESGVNDRDGLVAGVPVLGQLAGALADAGYLTVRYDKRGSGQTGGRAESATIGDMADDVRSIVRYLDRRKDIDNKRIVAVGQTEGAWIALLAATREKKIAGVVSIAAPAITGNELVLEQQRTLLEHMKVPDAERHAKIELQKQINAAAMSGKGWEGVPDNLRKGADTLWFQSLLAFDPARAIKDVEQPILILHGELDRQVPVGQADRLAELAKKSDSKSVEVITVRGVNHLLVPATTGEVGEYTTLTDKNVSKDVTGAITGWLAKTFAAIGK
jgi:dienelactone hydrolase